MSLVYYIVDTESNGLRPSWHEIFQISIIRCTDCHQLSRFIKISHPERSNSESLAVTGRTLYELRTIGEPKLKVIEEIEKFLNEDGQQPENRCMIAHQASFDKNFCHALWSEFNRPFPAICWLDTKPLAKSWAKKIGIAKPKLTLAASLEFAGVTPVKGQHNAVSDARNLYLLWAKAMEEKIDYLPYIKRYPHEIL